MDRTDANMLTATITDVKYVDKISETTTTPLGETSVVDVPLDSFVVTFSSGKVINQELWFKPEAIGNRIANYEPVMDHKEAIEALVRELVFSWAPSLTPADPDNKSDVNGGVDDRIAIEWKFEMDPAIVEDHSDRIEAAIETYSPRVDAIEDIFTKSASQGVTTDENPPA
jgi:hypothetical protein